LSVPRYLTAFRAVGCVTIFVKKEEFMDQTVKTFTAEGADARTWVGRIIVAVILGEAIWGLIVSVMNNLIVPWLGDVMGQSSGLPTSFTQRPYDYPDLFISVLEFCMAGTMAVILNYFFQRQRAGTVKPMKSSVPTAPVEPAQVVRQAAGAAAMTLAMSPVTSPAPVAKPDPVTPPLTVGQGAPAPSVALAPVARAAAVAPPPAALAARPVANSVATKPLQPAPKAEPSKLKKPQEVYYNIVGEPLPSDED
jgi:large-conductance mechanosensitive channel